MKLYLISTNNYPLSYNPNFMKDSKDLIIIECEYSIRNYNYHAYTTSILHLLDNLLSPCLLLM